MRRWWIAVALALSVGLNLGVIATLGVQWARDRREALPPAPPEGAAVPLPPAGDLARLGERLGLAGRELEAFAAAHREFVAAAGRNRAEMARLRREVRRELMAPAPRRDEVEAAIGRMAELFREQEELLARHVLWARDTLDGEAERRYLGFLARLGDEGRPGARPRDPRLPERRPWRRPPGAPPLADPPGDPVTPADVSPEPPVD